MARLADSLTKTLSGAELLGDPRLAAITVRAAALQPTRSGVWRALGEVEIGAVWRAATVAVRYRGVYRTGDTAKAWLTVHAVIDPAAHGLLTPKRVHLEADLLALAPARPAPSTSAPHDLAA